MRTTRASRARLIGFNDKTLRLNNTMHVKVLTLGITLGKHSLCKSASCCYSYAISRPGELK